ncbi:hypothetical protein F5146DRAFT_1036160 [Armillaria mellea]|nr:hypothetical protein F5146DRAFT_1036160 [Armillaria mellea]
MATQTVGSPGLTTDDIAAIFTYLDADLNSAIFQSQLHGIYTGIVALTLWNIYANKCQPIRRGMIVVIVILHVIATIGFALYWSYIRSVYVKNGQTFVDKYLAYFYSNGLETAIAITGIVSTIGVDSVMIWRCWMVWGKRWPIVVLPILFLVSGVVSDAMSIYKQSTVSAVGVIINMLMIIYLAFILATTLWCTLAIIFRILKVGRAGTRLGSAFRVYRHVIEILVESSALYAISLFLEMAMVACQGTTYYYMDAMAAFARGVAPTLLIGRVAAGHARPDDSWEGSAMSSLQFGRDSEQIGSQDDATQIVTVDIDLEVPSEGEDNLEGVSEQEVNNEGSFLEYGGRHTEV